MASPPPTIFCFFQFGWTVKLEQWPFVSCLIYYLECMSKRSTYFLRLQSADTYQQFHVFHPSPIGCPIRSVLLLSSPVFRRQYHLCRCFLLVVLSLTVAMSPFLCDIFQIFKFYSSLQWMCFPLLCTFPSWPRLSSLLMSMSRLVVFNSSISDGQCRCMGSLTLSCAVSSCPISCPLLSALNADHSQKSHTKINKLEGSKRAAHWAAPKSAR